jgi:predicted metal-binding protein
MDEFKELTDLARYLGASDTAVIDPAEIVIEERFARMCVEPRCRGYGQSLSCPPHVDGPQALRRRLPDFHAALVFKVDVPRDAAFSSERNEVLALIHEIAAGVEIAARNQEFGKARGFAGGSCKELFCADYPACRVLDEGKACRNPQRARPSMSGYGIDVARLLATAGWPPAARQEKDAAGLITFTGLVLLD